MSQLRENQVLTPVGRLVQGSATEPYTKDMLGNRLVNKDGTDRIKYFIALAIQKQGEQHWNQTEWGAKIWNLGQSFFPGGQANSLQFHWKITDGDNPGTNSDDPDAKAPNEHEGFPGHWVLKPSNGFPPILFGPDFTINSVLPDMFNLGNYAQVLLNISSNEQMKLNSGVHLNIGVIAFRGYGKLIKIMQDFSKVGFGQAPLPAGASLTPLPASEAVLVSATRTPIPAPAINQAITPAINTPQPPTHIPAAPPQVQPHYEILQGRTPLPAAPLPQLIVEAKWIVDGHTATLSEWLANGWNEQLLAQRGVRLL